MSGARILVMEDTLQVQRSLRQLLTGQDYEVTFARTGEAGLHEFARHLPDVVLLDLVLPDMDGLEVCRQIRTRSNVAVVVLSALDDEETKVAALDLGADDYITKPFGAQELLARVRVALRHSAGLPEQTFECGGVSIDLGRRTVTLEGQPVRITPREYDVLKFLIAHRDRVVTYPTILREVWGNEYISEAQYLRNIVLALRRKLEVDPSRPQLIVTEPGIGYSLRSEAELWTSPASSREA